ncbi:MAG TPA: ParB/RepB/Spo0J family partition protein [Candidatus Agathobaculum pullistercoris]|nr:ParB/RepB/Spo0J family partition protein [uncultured Agathobaculum sp.]HIX10746.1 ParB/RepB/Spo0J family partition protein [Candidatus Agathobaculum pullistercoris]
MASAKKGLGGGLSNLFGDDAAASLSENGAADSITQLPLTKIERNPNQPRKKFDQQALEELAESIRLHGVITPITVRHGEKDGYYQIIAGERRWRAARLAGLKEIPAMVLEAGEGEVMELALIENLQRQDLNPIEEAEGYDRLMQQFGLTQEEVANRVVKSRSAVANALRLLGLPDEVRTMVADGKLSGGHARAVLAVSDEDKRVEAARQMVGMSVRQAEALAKRLNKKPSVKPPQPEAFSVDYVADVEKELESVLGRKISIQQGKNSGQLTLEYYGADDLERLIEALRSLRV